MKLTEQEKKVVEVLEHFGYHEVTKSGGFGWQFVDPPWLQSWFRKNRLHIKVEWWMGKFTVATTGSHWSIEDAILMKDQLEFAIEVLTALIEVAPELVEMKHPLE